MSKISVDQYFTDAPTFPPPLKKKVGVLTFLTKSPGADLPERRKKEIGAPHPFAAPLWGNKPHRKQRFRIFVRFVGSYAKKDINMRFLA